MGRPKNFAWSVALMVCGTTLHGMNLGDAIQYGLSHSPKLQSSRALRESAKLTKESAQASYYPRLESSLSSSIGGDSVSTGRKLSEPQYGSNFEVRLGETLWDGGTRSYESDIADLADRTAELVLSEDRDQYILDLVHLYVNYSEAVVTLNAQLEHQKILAKQERDSDEAMRQGLRANRDHVRIQTEVQRNEVSLITARNALAKAKDAILAHLGVDADEAIDLTPLEPKSNLDSAVLETGRLPVSKTAAYQRISLLNEQSERLVDHARQQSLWPSVEVTAATGYRAQDFVGPDKRSLHDNDSLYWTVGLGVKYTIWDWGTRSRDVSKAVAQKSSDVALRDLEIRSIETKLEANRRDQMQAAQNHKLSAKLMRLDEDSFAHIEKDFKQGKVSYLDIVDAAEKLLRSREGLARAYFNWLRGVWDRKFYEGTIYDASLAKSL